MSKKRVCYVVCYRDPDYTRTNSLINAISRLDNVELLVVKNRHKGFLRYLEVPLRLLQARIKFRPDTFVVGFRADEIFWALWPAMIGKKIIFDEFIVLHDWLVDEHQKLKDGSAITRLVDGYMRWVAARSQYLLTDTEAHAKLAADCYRLDYHKVVAVPVGADEAIFRPLKPARQKGDRFEVFFYGTALPLHGVPVILEAIKLAVAREPNMHLTLVGGRGNSAYLRMIEDFRSSNNLQANLKVHPWVEYAKLPGMIAAADLCLGGPFGGTGQARRVIAGKTYQFLAMGKPTVVGRIEGATQFADKCNCLLVEQNSPKDLSKAILWAAQNKQALPKISKEARKLYDTNFSPKAISEILGRLL